MKQHTFLSRFTLIVILSLSVSIPVSSQQFTDSGQTLPGLYAGSSHWGYYDAGIYPDLAMTGLNSDGTPVTLLYSNSAGTLTEISHSVTGIYFGQALWGDYDNDGDPDLFVIGLDESGTEVAELWENNSGTFEKNTNQDLTGLRYAAASWGDVDNDGLIDLITTGMDRFGDPRTILYKNRKAEGVSNYLLEEVEIQSFLNIAKGSVAFGDFDNDGDLDLALSGNDASGFPNAALYINNPTGHFVYDNSNSQILKKLSSGSIMWGDADGDGYPDLLQTGLNSRWETATVLHENEHNSRFGSDMLSTIQDVAGDAVWGDFDNDGDFDIALSGKDNYSNLYGTVLTQISDFTFTENMSKFPSLRDGAISTVDYDQDGKLDLLVSGVNNSGQFQTSLYRNTTVSSKSTPQPPASLLDVVVTNDKVFFSWDKGSDSVTPDEILTYNIRVGTADKPYSIISSAVPFGEGNLGYGLTYTLNGQLAEGEYTWSVQTVNAQSVRSDWSTESTFKVEQFVSSLQNITGFKFAASDWGDYDNDGDLDLVIAGTDANDNNRALLYINNNGLLEEDLTTNTGLIKFNYGDFAWGDVDNDGDLDLAYTGFFIRQSPTSGLYINQNGFLFEQQGVFEQVGFASLDWGDYDNDGDIDLAVMGKTGSGPYITKVYKNDSGTLTEDTGQTLVPYANGQLQWVDYDNDGDLDLAVTGESLNSVQGNTDNYIRLYKNDPPGKLTEDTSQTLPQLQSSSFTWMDFDDDGDLDFVASGWSDETSQVRTIALVNNPTGTFTVSSSLSDGLPGVIGGALTAGDYDNDGDPDLIVTGFDLSNPVLQVFKKFTGSFDEEELEILDNRGVYFSDVSLVDIDADGDLELISIGQTTEDGVNFSSATNVYDNVNSRVNPNTAPTAPAGLKAEVSSGTVSLEWSASQDLPIGDPNRDYQTYQVRMGTSPGGDEIISGKIPARIGVYGSSLERTVTGLTSGDYYWSVRAIDNGLGVSEWSSQKLFRVDTDPPTVDSSSLTATPDSAGIGTVTILLNINENFALDNSAVPTVEANFTGGSTQAVRQLSYNGLSWIGELDVLSTHASGSVDFTVSGVVDAVGNAMEATTIEDGLFVDTDRPEILETTPDSDQLSVPTAITLTAVFDEPIDPASVDNSVMSLKLGSEEMIPASDVQVSSDAMSIFRLYSGLPGDSEFSAVVVAKVQDRVGNRMETFHSWLFTTAKVVSAQTGGKITNADSSVIVYFSPSALQSDAEIPIDEVTPAWLPDGVTYVDVAYQVGPLEGLTLNKTSRLEVRYNDSFSGGVSEDKLSLYIQSTVNPAEWEKVGGTVDPLQNSISASIDRLGTFALFEDLTGASGNESINEISFSPRVFAPKGTGFLPQETSINFVLGKDMNVTIYVFNSTGRVVRRLLDSRAMNAGHQSVIWNGKDYNGRFLPSGLYTVVLKSGGITEYKTVAISNK